MPIDDSKFDPTSGMGKFEAPKAPSFKEVEEHISSLREVMESIAPARSRRRPTPAMTEERARYLEAARVRREEMSRDYEALHKAVYEKHFEPRPFFVEFQDSWTNAQGGKPMSTMTETVVISMDPVKAALVMRSSYNEAFINFMKAKIPANQRRWDGVEKVWVFHPDALPALRDIIPSFYAGIKVVGVQRQIPATKFDRLMQKLSLKDKQAIYILLAKRHHPDAGGDRETMALVNEVFEK